jgi:peptidoglycan/xylan/chitin deacetylase (PgdA/CDA1 family)
MLNEISIVVYHDLSLGRDPLLEHLSLSTEPEIFRNHISYFSKNYDLISEDDLLADRLPKRPLLITFDDAYRSILTVGGPVLREFNAPSIFFLIPSVAKNCQLPMDNLLSLAVREIGLQQIISLLNRSAIDISSVGEIISRLTSAMARQEICESKMRIVSALGISETDVCRRSGVFINSDDMTQFPKYNITVGNHSMNHSRFRALSTDELNIEIANSRTVLRDLSGQLVRSLSIPYGDERDATDQSLQAISACGHQATFLVHARSNRFRPTSGCYYRVSMRNEAINEMRAKMKLFPVLRSIRAWITP